MGCKLYAICHCHWPFLMLQEGHEMANQSAPGGVGVKQHSSEVKHFLKGVEINLGGV